MIPLRKFSPEDYLAHEGFGWNPFEGHWILLEVICVRDGVLLEQKQTSEKEKERHHELVGRGRKKTGWNPLDNAIADFEATTAPLLCFEWITKVFQDSPLHHLSSQLVCRPRVVWRFRWVWTHRSCRMPSRGNLFVIIPTERKEEEEGETSSRNQVNSILIVLSGRSCPRDFA